MDVHSNLNRTKQCSTKVIDADVALVDLVEAHEERQTHGAHKGDEQRCKCTHGVIVTVVAHAQRRVINVNLEYLATCHSMTMGPKKSRTVTSSYNRQNHCADSPQRLYHSREYMKVDSASDKKPT